jgi:hypothetical protein
MGHPGRPVQEAYEIGPGMGFFGITDLMTPIDSIECFSIAAHTSPLLTGDILPDVQVDIFVVKYSVNARGFEGGYRRSDKYYRQKYDPCFSGHERKRPFHSSEIQDDGQYDQKEVYLKKKGQNPCQLVFQLPDVISGKPHNGRRYHNEITETDNRYSYHCIFLHISRIL